METEKISIQDLMASIMNSMPNSYDEYQMMLHSHQRDLYLGDVDSESALEIVSAIIDYNREDTGLTMAKRKPIRIFINSGGGSITDGYSIMDAIEMSQTPVYTIGIAPVYSMAAHILLSGHRRIMYPRATLMFHEGSTSISGDTRKVNDTVKFFEKLAKRDREFILSKTKITEELYYEKEANDWFLTATECLELGIIEEIATTLY